MTRLLVTIGVAGVLGAGAMLLAAGSCGDEGSGLPGGPTTTAMGGAASGTGGAATSSGGSGAVSTGGGPAGGSPTEGGAASVIDYCTGCTPPVAAGALALAVIDEASGLGASRIHEGLLYVNNDSGDSARFFAVDSSGADRGTFTLSGASATDWEDLAVGPCGDGHRCVYLADVGDNGHVRDEYAVYRVREPETVGSGVHPVASERLRLRYPDGSQNCETLLVHPVSGELALVTKVDGGPSSIYLVPAPLDPNSVATLEKVGEVAPPEGSNQFTSGDVHPTARGIVLRTYSHLWLFPGEPGETIAEMLGHHPCALPVATEPQGEAVAWAATGERYWTVSEGAGSTLYKVTCSVGR